MRTCTSLILACLLLGFATAQASPNSFTYQGRIVRDDGTALEYNNVSFAFSIVNAAGNCVIYREQRDNINMTGSSGVFDVPIGTGGTKIYPASATFKLRDAFNNSIIQNCEGGSTYTPAEDDIRLLAVQFHDGTGWKQITPNSEIRSVPFASYAYSAARLGDKLPTDYVDKSLVTTCSAGQYSTFNGTNFVCATDSGGTGTIADVNVTAPLTKGGTATTPIIGISVGTGAGTVAAGNDSRFTDSRAPNGTATGDLTASYPNPTVAKIRGYSVSTTAPTAGTFLKYNSTSSEWEPVAMPSCSASQTLTFDITGTAACTNISVSATGAAGGDLSGTYPNPSLATTAVTAGSYGSATSVGTFTVDGKGRLTAAASTAITFPVTSVASKTGAVVLDASDITSAAGKYLTYKPNNVACSDQQVLKWIDANSRWECAAVSGSSGTVTNVTGTLPIVVATGSSTPAISINDATTTTKGVVQVGAGIAVSSGTITADPANFSTAVPVAKGGTGATSMTANRLIASNGTGSALTPFTCALTELVTFDASGVPGCTAISTVVSSGGAFKNGGNAFGAATSIGTTDAQKLSIIANNAVGITVDTAGLVGVGTASPVSALNVAGSTVLGLASTNYTGTAATVIRGPANSPNIIMDSTANSGMLKLNWSGTTFSINQCSNATCTSGYPYFSIDMVANNATFSNTNSVIAGNGNGNASAPTYTFSTSTTSGMYSPSANTLSLSTNSTQRLQIDASGKVGIGSVAAANTKLTVAGTIVSTPPTAYAGATVDLSTSNTQVLNSVGGTAITLNNMVHGGTYTLVIQDTTSRTYTFSGCNSTKFSPPNTATTSGTQSIYSILTVYNGMTYDCYITWSTGFQ